MRSMWVVAILLLWAVPALAAPAVTGVTGSFVAGDTVAISGTGFGVKSPALPVLWDDFEGHTNGAAVGSPVVGTYSRVGGTKYSTVSPYAGSMCAYSDTSTLSLPTGLVCNWVPLTARDSFASMRCKFVSSYGSISPHNTKFLRINSHSDVSFEPPVSEPTHGYPNVSLGKESGSLSFWGRINHGLSNYVAMTAPGALPVTGGWNGAAVWGRCGDVETANGFAGYYWGGRTVESTNVVTLRLLYRGIPAPGDNGYLSLPGYRSAFFCGYVDAAGYDVDVYLDDVYADTSLARVEIGNASTWASCTHREILVPTAWSGTSVSARVNLGTFTSDSTAYLFVVDPDGAVSAGYAVVLGADGTPPSAVSTLAVASRTHDSATLTWTAVGDDGGAGTAAAYDLRYSAAPITEETWAAATPVSGEPAPRAAGQADSVTVTGLTVGARYYFAVKVADEVPNWSGLSNEASAALVSDHPRLLIHADSLAVWKARITGGGNPFYATWKGYYDGYLSTDSRGSTSARWHCPEWAMLWHITGGTAYRDRVIDELMLYNRSRTAAWSDGNLMQSDSFGRQHPMVYAFDWICNDLTTAQRDSCVQGILGFLEATGGPSTSYHRTVDNRFPMAITLLGELSGADSTYVEGVVQGIIDTWEDHCFPCLDEVAGGGSDVYYPAIYAIHHMLMVDALQFGCLYDGPILASSYYRHMADFWVHLVLSGWRTSRLDGRYNYSEFNAEGFYGYFASHLGSLEAQTMAKDPILTNAAISYPDYQIFGVAWYNPNLASVPYASFRKQFTDDQAGYYFWRSGWDQSGATDRSVTVHFYNGPDAHPDSMRTQNELTVTRGTTDLLITSSHFYDSADQHLVQYGYSSASRNTALIYDPAEQFTKYGSVLSNDGGQRMSDFSKVGTYWPSCYPGSVGWRGSADTLAIEPGLLWGVRGDATPAYNPVKASRVVRAVRIPVDGWILVQDLIEPAVGESLDCAVGWHMIDQPTIDGVWGDTLRGSSHGGVFRSTNAGVVTVRRTNTQYSYTSKANLYPWASGGVPELRMIGGKSRNDEQWKQSVDSGNAWSFKADTLDQSFECFTGYYGPGRNHSPSHDGFSASDTAFASSSCVNKEPTACGRWRVEYLIPDAPALLEVATAIQVGPDSIATRTVTWADTSGGVQCRIRGAGTAMLAYLRHLEAAPADSVILPVMGSVFPQFPVQVYVYGMVPGTYPLCLDGTPIDTLSTAAGTVTFSAATAGTYRLGSPGGDSAPNRSRQRRVAGFGGSDEE